MSVDQVQDIEPLVQYTASGGQTIFSYPFAIFADADLVVYDNDTLQTLSTDYTVSGAGDDTGGNVTFLTGRTAGNTITIYRDIGIARTTDFQQNGPRRSADMNDELDRMTMWMQQLERNIGRAVRLSLRNSQVSSELELDPISNWASRYLYINSNGELEPAAAITVTTLTQAVIAGLLTPQTSAESAAGVTPVNSAYFPGDIRRYGGSEAAAAATNDLAILNALASNNEVVIPRTTTGVYNISASIILTKFGHRIRGEGTADLSDPTAAAVTLNVVSGFPTVGGDAAQSVFQITNRYQSVENLLIDCNGIAAHALFGTGADASFGHHKDLFILSPNGDGVLYRDNTWMNTFEKIRVEQPINGWCFNFDDVAAAGHTTTTLINCYAKDLANGMGTALGGFRFDKALTFRMITCAADSQFGGPAVRLEAGSQVSGNLHTEGTDRLIDIVDAESFLSLTGCQFNGYGSNTLTIADVINCTGGLRISESRFLLGEASTVFANFGSGAKVDWHNNTLLLFDQTNTINASAQIHADHVFQPSASSTARQRFEIRGGTPRFTLYETDQGLNLKGWDFRVVNGVLQVATIADAYGTVSNILQYTRSTAQWEIAGLVNYANDAAAASGGVPVGGLYRNGSVVQIRVT